MVCEKSSSYQPNFTVEIRKNENPLFWGKLYGFCELNVAFALIEDKFGYFHDFFHPIRKLPIIHSLRFFLRVSSCFFRLIGFLSTQRRSVGLWNHFHTFPRAFGLLQKNKLLGSTQIFGFTKNKKPIFSFNAISLGLWSYSITSLALESLWFISSVDFFRFAIYFFRATFSLKVLGHLRVKHLLGKKSVSFYPQNIFCKHLEQRFYTLFFSIPMEAKRL